MTSPDEPAPIGPHEIAALLGVSRQRFDQLSRQVGFPPAWAELRTGRIWRDTDIKTWAAGRPRKEK